MVRIEHYIDTIVQQRGPDLSWRLSTKRAALSPVARRAPSDAAPPFISATAVIHQTLPTSRLISKDPSVSRTSARSVPRIEGVQGRNWIKGIWV